MADLRIQAILSVIIGIRFGQTLMTKPIIRDCLNDRIAWRRRLRATSPTLEAVAGTRKTGCAPLRGAAQQDADWHRFVLRQTTSASAARRSLTRAHPVRCLQIHLSPKLRMYA